MLDTTRLFTPAEAAAVSGLGLKAVNNAIDKRIVADNARRGARRYLTPSDLLCLRLEFRLAGSLPVERRQALFREVVAKPRARLFKANDLLLVDIAEARRQVADRMRRLDQAESLIESNRDLLGGEPVIKGTRLPAYGIAALLDAGVGPAELTADHPGLDLRKIDLVRLWVAAHPRRGRPKRLADYGFMLKSSSSRKLPPDPFDAAGKTAPP